MSIVSRLRAAGCVFAEDEARMITSTARTPEELDSMVERRASGVPLEHVVGWAEFCGLRVGVTPGVFVPRRRTEYLVAQAVARARPGAVVLDLCCGSGAVGLAVAAALGDVELHAADIEAAAVDCARHNLVPHVHHGDLFDPLPHSLRGRVGVLAANVPYVPTDEIGLLPAEARLHEPHVTLDGGDDGLDIMRRVAAEGPRWLAPGGFVLVETSEDQASEAARAFLDSGLAPVVATSDDLDATVVIGVADTTQ